MELEIFSEQDGDALFAMWPGRRSQVLRGGEVGASNHHGPRLMKPWEIGGLIGFNLMVDIYNGI